jgi:hypothetical protein
VFWEERNGARLGVALRERILEEKDTLPVDVLGYVHRRPPGAEDAQDADTIMDRCFNGIRQCDLFVFILTRRHGTGVAYLDDPALVSYLELELFAAAILGKPILVLHQRGYEPEGPLRDCLSRLPVSGEGEYMLDDEGALFARFREACRLLAEGRWKPRGKLARLPEWLSLLRSGDSVEGDLAEPALLFLGGRAAAAAPQPDPARAQALLDQVGSGVRTVSGTTAPMPHGAALFRLWASWRELGSPRAAMDVEIAELWDRLFGLWASSASWFGLHGHLWMSPLAAINSQLHIRKRLAAGRDLDVREPHGARASALYSIAQRMTSRRRKLFHYDQVSLLAGEAMRQDANAAQGALSIRAHALLRIATLGRPWELWTAKADFRRALQLCEAGGAPLAGIGVAQVDLGFCQVLTGEPFAGRALMKEGIANLRTDATAGGLAFLARGLRKLETASLLTLSPSAAARAREERLQIAGKIEAFDQARTD